MFLQNMDREAMPSMGDVSHLSLFSFLFHSVSEAAYKMITCIRANTSAVSPSSAQASSEHNVYPQVPKGKNQSPSRERNLREFGNRERHVLAQPQMGHV